MASDQDIWDAFDSSIASIIRNHTPVAKIEGKVVDGTLVRVRITRQTLLESMKRRVAAQGTEPIKSAILGRLTDAEYRDARRYYIPLQADIQRLTTALTFGR